jgi:4-carboxymuconolactone decarboxylase
MAGALGDHPAAGVSPHLVELTQDVLFGDVWERPQLSKRDRSIATVAVLIAKFRTDELRSHLNRALDNGVTEEEIGELICHLAFYGGWPAAASAVNIAHQVFEERAAAEPSE